MTLMKLAGSMLASSVLVAAGHVALANGQGTPIEPAPEPAPTVMEPAPPPPPPPPPVMEEPVRSSWGGLYVGGHVGYGWLGGGDDETLAFDTDLDGTYGDALNTAAGAPYFTGFCKGLPGASGCEDDSDGGIDAGLRVGYDWDLDGFVVGALLEGSYVDISDSVTGASLAPDAYSFTRELNFLGAARLRAGAVIADDYLLYATGGVAYGGVDRTFATTNATNGFIELEDNAGDGSWGWQLGGGLEAKLADNWSLGVEYLYTSLSDDEYAIAVTPGAADPLTNPFLLVDADGANMTRSNDRFEIHSVRAVVNYRFGE